MNTVRIEGPNGTDTVSCLNSTYTIDAHGGFDVPAEVAAALCNGVAGFTLAPPRTDGRVLADIIGLADTLPEWERAAIRKAVAAIGAEMLARSACPVPPVLGH